jgi:hypothetical protein
MMQSGDPPAAECQSGAGKWAMLKEEAVKRRDSLESATDAYNCLNIF